MASNAFYTREFQVPHQKTACLNKCRSSNEFFNYILINASTSINKKNDLIKFTLKIATRIKNDSRVTNGTGMGNIVYRFFFFRQLYTFTLHSWCDILQCKKQSFFVYDGTWHFWKAFNGLMIWHAFIDFYSMENWIYWVQFPQSKQFGGNESRFFKTARIQWQ